MARDGQSAETAYRLGEVSAKISGWINKLGSVWVEGQIVEISQTRGGGVFLVLRDPQAEMSMTVDCSRATFDQAGAIPQGTTVTAFVKAGLFAKSGKLSLRAAEIRPTGEGRLLAQLEQRKQLLRAEGLFDAARKKRLPFAPRAIGLVTSGGSDAERDVVTNVRLRWPGAVIVTQPVRVQGPTAAEEVMAALHTLDVRPEVEVIIVTRGGGSFEDLLPFSDEGVVRAAAACRTPIVSAIGHEADTPLLDLVADLRASTPTDAAKRVVPDAAEQQAGLDEFRTRLRRAVEGRLATERQWLDHQRSRPVLRNPAASVDAHAERVEDLRERVGRAVVARLRSEQTGVEHALQRLRAMSPKATLERGYAILVDADGGSVAGVADVEPGDQIRAYVTDGELILSVDDVTQSDRGES